MHPDPAAIIKASVFVVIGCVGCGAAVHAAMRTRNWLYLVCALGSLALVAGIVGQRVFPSDDLIRQVGADAANHTTPGPWDGGVSVPVIDVKATPVAIGGVLVAMLGLSLVLFFEAAVPEESVTVRRARTLEEDGAV
jgi:hypothetical protein